MYIYVPSKLLVSVMLDIVCFECILIGDNVSVCAWCGVMGDRVREKGSVCWVGGVS